MKPNLSEEEYREMKRKKAAYKKHKCKGCPWASWQKEDVVMCLFPVCVKEKKGW